MSVTRLANRYAKSLIDLAKERDEVDEVLNDIRDIQSALENVDFRLLVKSPIVKASQKLEVLEKIFSGRIGDLSYAFIRKLVQKSREKYILEITEAYEAQYRKLKGITVVHLITATELNEETLDDLRKTLAESTVTEETIELNTRIDPEIIGGFVIEFEDKMYDASVKHQLEELRQKLTKRVTTA